MPNRTTVLTLAALLLVPALSAQDDEGERTLASRERQGRIGVLVETHPDAERDKLGAEIDRVMPGSPADEAGLRAGDVITRFNGTALGGAAAGSDDESGPGRKLLDLARQLSPGDTVRLEYRRGNEARQATLVAERMEGISMVMPRMPGMPRIREFRHRGEGGEHHFEFGPRHFDFEAGPGRVEMFVERGFGGIHLVDLNPDLGAYFGTQEGVLVVKAPEDTTLGLKGGDVLLTIDGRKVESPSHAMRILRSYNGGEKARLEVMRQKRRTTVEWTVPERDRKMRMEGPERIRPSRGAGRA